MKNYTLAGFASLIFGWIAAALFYGLFYTIYREDRPGHSMFPDFLAPSVVATCSLLISLLLNFLAIQLPRLYVKKVFYTTNSIVFSLATSLYGLLVFATLFGWIFSDSNASAETKQITLLIFGTAAINGLVFGFAFHTLWKPTIQAA